MPPDGRRDTLAFKERLNGILGDNAPKYWSVLREFLTGRLNRDEFDHWAQKYLPPDQVYMHNEFLLATLFNALLETPPPDNGRGTKRKLDDVHGADALVGARAGQSAGDGAGGAATQAGEGGPGDYAGRKELSSAEARRRALKQAIRALSKSDRDRIKGLLKKKPAPPARSALPHPSPRICYPPPLVQLAHQGDGRSVPGTNPEAISAFASEYMRNVQAPLCGDAKGIPSGDALLDRMHAVAMEHGIQGIQQDAVRLMFSALEIHMKTVIGHCVSKLRLNRTIGIRMPTVADAPPATEARLSSKAASATASGALPHSADSSSTLDAAANTESATGASARHSRHRRPDCAAQTSITARDLAFVAQLAPHVMVESPLNLERLTSVVLSNPRLEEELTQRARHMSTVTPEESNEEAALDAFLAGVLGMQYA
ncbi:transcriptional regulator of RNA polII, SAGA, subunit-domain-containing protein [Thamnocephalis sphaerospora]|uniref:Transcriptional regulator of RNA polII, SAGA, subunit-domain-containing protein n=1 Tax=Thamnocephalis sphaerospora TaxID=78915 RepID=A0A4V1IX10_9FUNG|nr:transcriptional regulator of RNA polII, SAGA, subunit-domain-containing protein [Thamnocephalis sphaerospora]|eukprot:RKP09429.1 transcriptional regulator of RNA polII, SAGA, subunit-domain-containing protein [Thamnocephalis sphaerospora]